MSRELLVLRHAKSAWDTGAASDFERPLAQRGEKDAPRLGKWMRKHHLHPDYVVSSPARRAQQTVTAICAAIDIASRDIVFDDTLYLAERSALLARLAACPGSAQRVLMVGHNPGLDELVEHLCCDPLPLSAKGKLMTTCALARIEMPDDWSHLPGCCGKLHDLVRASELN